MGIGAACAPWVLLKPQSSGWESLVFCARLHLPFRLPGPWTVGAVWGHNSVQPTVYQATWCSFFGYIRSAAGSGVILPVLIVS